jgi:S-adenosylmethionine:tRNA ribosyltransferase-isomerase
MDLNDFAYELPDALIAPFPSRDRAASRLLVLERRSGRITHAVFSQLPSFLDPGDLLVLNDTRVFPARLRGVKSSGGKVEILLLEQFPAPGRNLWLALVDAAKRPRVGSLLRFDGGLTAEVIGALGRGRFGLEFVGTEDVTAALGRLGEMPLPPYVTRRRDLEELDRERYQTVYAVHDGAIAAPTAGFHFTPELFADLARRGILRTTLTLHVGPGTFQPVRAQQVENHRMEGERYILSSEAAAAVVGAKRDGHRVIAVGSTSTRTLEWVARERGQILADEGIARLFLHPGDSFRVIDALITNFHLPGSTPLILVAAFAGLELTRRAYNEAIEQCYRFYSYGDAMLIL